VLRPPGALPFSLTIFLLLACTAEERASTPSPTPGLTPASAPAPRLDASPIPAQPAPEVPPELRVAGRIPLPADLALVLEGGCFGCDGPPTGLNRVYRQPSGSLRYEFLTTAERLPSSIQDQRYQSFTRFLVTESIVQAGTCAYGDCSWRPEDAREWVFESSDGGVTWTPRGQRDLMTVAVQAPLGAFSQRRPLRLPDAQLLWPSEDGASILRADGSRFLTLNLGVDAALLQVIEDPNADVVAVLWSRPKEGRLYLGAVQASTGQTYVYRAGNLYSLAGWLDGRRLIGTLTLSGLDPGPPNRPVLIDIGTGEMQAINEVDAPQLGRGLVRLFFKGPFARVIDTGSCLNLRQAPDANAPVPDCMADGVLVTDLGQTNGGWVRVRTPAGLEGWASERFLER